jgi:acetyl-CoA synthetase
MYYAGDAAEKDADGYIWFAGRADEVMKIAAHRIGTVEVENALVSHPAVVEAAVTGVPDELRGEIASAFVVLRSGHEPSDELKKELINHVRKEMGAIVVMKDIGFPCYPRPAAARDHALSRPFSPAKTGRPLIEEEA